MNPPLRALLRSLLEVKANGELTGTRVIGDAGYQAEVRCADGRCAAATTDDVVIMPVEEVVPLLESVWGSIEVGVITRFSFVRQEC